jgi:N-acetylmuramoyl-L-alanine amidase
MVNLLGGRNASAIIGFCMLAIGSSGANAQDLSRLNVAAAVKAVDAGQTSTPQTQIATPAATQKVAAVAIAVPTASGAMIQAQPARTVNVSLGAPIAQEAPWLYRNGWPLYALVARYGTEAPLEEQANCIAVAVYHEARGETLEGQLAVARVIMNRAASGKYPSSWCGTVKQPWQFSFVNPHDGHMPGVDKTSASWRRALGITRLALANVVPSIGNDVLWYHADYVAPSWGRRLTQVSKIGQHIFYRA